MNRRKDSLLGAGVLSVGYAVWGAILAFITIPVMIGGLGLASYGIYTLAFSIAGFGAFLELGLGWTISRFVAEADAINDRGLLAATMRVGVLCQLGVALLFILIVYSSTGGIARAILPSTAMDIPVMEKMLRIATFSFACSSLGGIFISALRGLRRFTHASIISAISVTVSVGGAATMAWMGKGVVAAAIAQLIGAILGLILGASVCQSYFHGSGSSVNLRSQFHRMLGFSVFTYLNRLTQIVVLQVDKVLVGKYCGTAFLPVYTVPFGFAQKTNFIAGPAVAAIYPTAAAEQNNPEIFFRKYFSSARLVHMLTGGGALAILFLGNNFLSAWVGLDLASRCDFYLRIFTVGYWLVSVGSFDAGCIEGWNRPAITFSIGAIGLILAVGMGILCWNSLGAPRSIAVSVTGWLVFVGIGDIFLWHRISRYSMKFFFPYIVRPLAEMAIVGFLLSFLINKYFGGRFFALASLPVLAIILAIYGSFRAFSKNEILDIMNRLRLLNNS